MFWLILKNLVFFGLWIAALLSGCCVSAHDTAATWLMNALGVSPFLLSPIGIEGQHGFLSSAKPGDGPVTVTMDFIIIRPEAREKFPELAEQIRLIILRNGAFLFNIDEKLEYPGTLRTEKQATLARAKTLDEQPNP